MELGLLKENSKGKLELQDVNFETESDIYNVVYQHEIDHVRGILLYDIGQEIIN
jgi:peptide deformylase